ncbi:hypothetical protein NSE01_38920 [Novosphingobium sediminis]|uniref:Uncharacterized protein n=1 Tax=Novosphingobium sediminis TaxID=707214 RepID=A0A512AQU2_9SPHN|nr:hypothetical protein NSE01_38920 [Novosphingobium sediminis]
MPVKEKARWCVMLIADLNMQCAARDRCIRAFQALFSVPLSQQRRYPGEPLVSTTRPCGRARVAGIDVTAQGTVLTT